MIMYACMYTHISLVLKILLELPTDVIPDLIVMQKSEHSNFINFEQKEKNHNINLDKSINRTRDKKLSIW